MGGCNDGPNELFRYDVLSTESGLVTQRDSAVQRIMGQDLNFQGMIHNISGTGSQLALKLWGSVDGKIFRQIGGSPNRNSFGPLPAGVATSVQIIYFFVRAIFATSTGTGVCEFSVSYTSFNC